MGRQAIVCLQFPCPHICGFSVVLQRLEGMWGHSGQETGRNLSEITQQTSGRAGARTILTVPTFLILMLG